MTVLTGHFDGRHVVIDGPIPRSMRVNTRVKVVIGADVEKGSRGARTPKVGLPSLAALKAQLKAGSGTSLKTAEANATKLIGRTRI